MGKRGSLQKPWHGWLDHGGGHVVGAGPQQSAELTLRGLLDVPFIVVGREQLGWGRGKLRAWSVQGGGPGLRMLLDCGRRTVVATSKKNACVSLVFSFLYKVVQVSRAAGAPARCWSLWHCRVSPCASHPRRCSSPREFWAETPGNGLGELQLPCVWESTAVVARPHPGEERKMDRRR